MPMDLTHLPRSDHRLVSQKNNGSENVVAVDEPSVQSLKFLVKSRSDSPFLPDAEHWGPRCLLYDTIPTGAATEDCFRILCIKQILTNDDRLPSDDDSPIV